MRKIVQTLALALLMGCLSDPDPKLVDNWTKSKPASFSYTYEVSCFCFPWQLYSVRATADSVVEAYRLFHRPGSATPDSVRMWSNVQGHSIDSLMAMVRRDLAQAPEAVDVEYHGTYGFPSLVSIDFVKQMADDEYTLRISNFQEHSVAPTPLSWRAYQPEFFAYTVTRECFCPAETRGPFSVYASRDTVFRVYRLTGADSLRMTAGILSYSVDSLLVEFHRIAGTTPHVLSLRYNPVFGYPDSAWTDPMAQNVDDEYGFSITGFRAVEYWPYWLRN